MDWMDYALCWNVRGDIYGIKICRNAPIISRLLFADNSFMFFRANTEETNVMKDILVTSSMGFENRELDHDKVYAAIYYDLYYESLLPSSLVVEIEKMMNSFLWGHKRDGTKGIHWLSWDRLSMPKCDGGMGFKSINAFNLPMSSKQAWRFMTNPDSLVSRLYKARYFPNCDFLNFNIGHNPSYVWRSFWSSKFVVKGVIKWSIGSGENISVWNYNWLLDGNSLVNPWSHNLVVRVILEFRI
ncbi:uncharacterized mitochondrial protein AtMg00310-like [Vicia villosa]|uniref:uncharacterized mitochondrial protein AtMg00310-like n=1 Tax=Vicia villosa TaxID=3911 RepID=UPI00273C899D|nr:uncharacterized mitochondrial protein AtMg00310-like [Vicia villosa]